MTKNGNVPAEWNDSVIYNHLQIWLHDSSRVFFSNVSAGLTFPAYGMRGILRRGAIYNNNIPHIPYRCKLPVLITSATLIALFGVSRLYQSESMA